MLEGITENDDSQDPAEQKDPSSQGPHNERARGARHEDVASLVPAGSRRQSLAQDSAGMNGLKRKNCQGRDLRTQERKEHSHLQADGKQPSVVSRLTRHSALDKIVETPGGTERQVSTL